MKKSSKCVVKLPDLRKIKVTAKDIKDGEQNDPGYCAIALAVRRQCKGFEIEDVQVSGDFASVSIIAPANLPIPQVCIGGKLVPMPGFDALGNNRTFLLELNLGKAGRTFVTKFDTDRTSVKPRTFTAKPSLLDY